MKIKRVAKQEDNLPAKVDYFISRMAHYYSGSVEEWTVTHFEFIAKELKIPSRWESYPQDLNPRVFVGKIMWKDVEDNATALKTNWRTYFPRLLAYARGREESSEEVLEVF